MLELFTKLFLICQFTLKCSFCVIHKTAQKLWKKQLDIIPYNNKIWTKLQPILEQEVYIQTPNLEHRTYTA